MPARPITNLPARVALLGNQRLYRQALRRLLASIAKVTVVDDQPLTSAAIRNLRRLEPDVIVVDLGDNAHDYLDSLGRMTKAAGDTPFVIITRQAGAGSVAALARLNVLAIVSTWSDRSELRHALACVQRAEHYVSPDLVIPNEPEPGQEASGAERLSPRQRQVLEFIARGDSVRDIARWLDISTKTVETHRARAQQLLGLDSSKALTVWAIRHLSPPAPDSTAA